MSMSESGQYDLLDQLAEEFAERFRRGERPALKEYTDRYPDLADEIRDLFPAMIKVEQAEGGLQGDEAGPDWSPRAASPLPRQIGDYRILREIGRGGMGVVYEAEQVSLGRRVALKVLPGPVSGDRMILERFRREARAAARLHHTNIVPVYEVGQDGDVRFYAMQFIQGLGLDAVIAELRRHRDRPGSRSRIGSAAEGPSARPGGEHLPRGIDTSTLGERVEVRAVLQYILTGRFDASSRSPETVEAPISVGASTLDGGLAAPITIEIRAAGSDSAPAVTQAGGDPIGPVPAHPLAPASASSTLPSSSSAILPGGTQLSSVESGRRAFFRSLAQIGRQVAGGLAYAHARGIVHRDIKPSNLLLDTEGVVWIADFGLAKGEDEGLTQSGDILGTIRYMAPERFRGEGDARADVYALGMTLYELLTLIPGFDSPDRLKLIEQIKTEEPTKPRSVDGRIPRDLETIVLKAIEKDPKARYQTAEAMGEDLGRFLADQPIRARRISAAEHYWRWAHRNPVIAVLGGVLTAVLVATTLGSMVAATYFRTLGKRAETARDQAQRSRDQAQQARDQAQQARDQAQQARERAEASLYLSHITLADSALRATETGTAHLAISQCVPTGSAPDPRGWEWYYLHHWLRADRRLFSGHHPQYVTNVAFSPDGTVLASAGGGNLFYENPGAPIYPGQVILRDPRTGSERHRLEGHQHLIGPLAFSVDGHRLASAGADRVIKVWDVATGRPLASFIGPGDAPFRDLRFFPDGRRLAYLSKSGRAFFLAADTGRELHAFPGTAMAVSPDGTSMATCHDSDVQVHEADSGRLLFHTPGRGMTYSADGNRLFVADPRDDAIHALDARTGREQAVLRGAGSPQEGRLMLDPSGRYLVDPLDASSLGIWDTSEGRFSRRITLPAGVEFQSYASSARAEVPVAFSRDGSLLAAITGVKTVRVWEVSSGREQAVLLGHDGNVTALAFSPDGQLLATSSLDGTVRLWDPHRHPAGLAIQTRIRFAFMASMDFSPDGSTIHTVTSAENGTAVETWDARSGARRERHPIDASRFLHWPRADFVFSPDGRYLAAPADGNRAVLSLFDVATGRLLTSLRRHKYHISAMAFSPDGHRLASAAPGGPVGWDVTIWDPAAGTELRTISGTAAGQIQSISFSPDGRSLAVGGVGPGNGFVALLDPDSGRTIRTWNDGGIIYSLAFRPDGAQLAGAGYNSATIYVWNVATGEKLHKYDGIPAASCVTYSPDGRRLAGMGYSGEVHLWDVGSGQEMLILRPFSPPAGSLGFTPRIAFSPDGSRIAANSAHGIITVWDAGANAVPDYRELDPSQWQRRADLALRSGRWDEAIEDSSRLLERDPDDLEARLIRARASLALDDLEPAGSDVDRSLRKAPEDPRFLALAGEIHNRRGHRLMEQGHPEEARKSWELARAAYETLLRLHPDQADAAARFADVLLQSRDTEATSQWDTLRPVEMTSSGGATLTGLSDGSVLASEKNPDLDVYTLTVRGSLKDITAFRLEALPHPSLPGGGCGRNPVDGTFSLGTFRIELGQGGAPGGFRSLTFTRVLCDDLEPIGFGVEAVLDQNDETSWSTGPSARTRGPHRVLFVLDRPLSEVGESTLQITMVFRDVWKARHLGLGRFRLSATRTPWPLLNLEETAYARFPGWTRLGAAHALRGEWSEAVDALSKADAASGCDRFLLAWADHRLGRDGEARRELERAVAWMKQHDSGDELYSLAAFVMTELPGTGQAGSLARLPADEQKAWKALGAELDSLLKRAAPSRAAETNLEPDNPQALDALHRRAHALARSNPREAEPLFRQALEGYRKAQGPDAHLTIDLTRDLANVLQQTGRSAEAEPLLRDALERARNRLRDGDPRAVQVVASFGMSLYMRSRWSEAEPLLREALERARKQSGPGDPRNASLMAPLAMCLIKQGKWIEAEPLLREVLAIREKTQPGDWTTFNTRSMLGGSLLGQKRYAEAEPLIVAGYEGMKAREAGIQPDGRPRVTEAAERLIKLYDAWGKPDKAAEWRARLARSADQPRKQH